MNPPGNVSTTAPVPGQETIPADEPAQIAALTALHRSIQEEKDRPKNPVPRNVHPKQHGCVRAELMIAPNLADELRHGLFREPRTYPAVVRFSNAKQLNDQLPDGHGMAVKLLGVEGPKLLEADGAATTHDLVLVDHPVFFAKDVADMLPMMRDFQCLMTGGALAKMRTVLKAAVSRDYRYRILRKMGAKRPDNPLEIQYWSTTPYKLGDGAMKFSLRPELNAAPSKSTRGKDKLRLAMSAHLRTHEARFDLLVQLQTDPVAMSLENASVEWDERVSPWRKVATLRIPPQTFERPEQMAFGNNLSFTPWHALTDHRPLGGINRSRKVVYRAMAGRRRELNGVLQQEPTVEEVRALWDEND
jgi:hypothetical protein